MSFHKNKSSYIGQIWKCLSANEIVVLVIDEKLMIEEMTYTSVTCLCLGYTLSPSEVGSIFYNWNIHLMEEHPIWKRLA
jgi:hypothetical protein